VIGESYLLNWGVKIRRKIYRVFIFYQFHFQFSFVVFSPTVAIVEQITYRWTEQSLLSSLSLPFAISLWNTLRTCLAIALFCWEKNNCQNEYFISHTYNIHLNQFLFPLSFSLEFIFTAAQYRTTQHVIRSITSRFVLIQISK
jgi:hypothetical protein